MAQIYFLVTFKVITVWNRDCLKYLKVIQPSYCSCFERISGLEVVTALHLDLLDEQPTLKSIFINTGTSIINF